MSLVELCNKDAILCDLEVSDKEDGIRQLLDALAAVKAFPKNKTKAILNEVIARERDATTGIGNGVGVPHARSKHAKKVTMAIGRIPGGIEFGAVDGERVRVVLLLISAEPDRDSHLAAMRAIVQIVRDPYQCKRLHGCSTPESFLDLLGEIAS